MENTPAILLPTIKDAPEGVDAFAAYVSLMISMLQEPFVSSDAKQLIILSSFGFLEKAGYTKEQINEYRERVAEIVEKFTAIYHIPPHTKEMTHHTDDEIWFTMRSKRWSNEKNNPVLPEVPEWEHPQGGVSSKGVPLNCYIALKRFMKKPENRKKILNQRTAKKFGI